MTVFRRHLDPPDLAIDVGRTGRKRGGGSSRETGVYVSGGHCGRRERRR